MEETIGYGGSPQRQPVRPVFVATGSEAAAAVADEGWNELEHAFFFGGAVLDQNLSALPIVPRRPSLWRRVAAWSAELLRLLTSVR